ncbi:MAG: hypothetical protein HOP19_11905 [Acidobacteria bacterium]|nr:hypothetical protein [Acidobacteriota bacterium]
MHHHKLPVLLTFLLAFCFFATAPTWAQKGKKVTKPATKGIKPRIESAEPASPAVNLAAEAALVAEQIKLITRFTFVYGKVMNSLEMAAEEEKKGRASAAVIEQTRKGREAIVANIADLAAGLDKVTARMQANPRLQVQYLKVSYAAEPLANARQLAAAGQLNEAGKALVLAVERLADAMLALR